MLHTHTHSFWVSSVHEVCIYLIKKTLKYAMLHVLRWIICPGVSDNSTRQFPSALVCQLTLLAHGKCSNRSSLTISYYSNWSHLDVRPHQITNAHTVSSDWSKHTLLKTDWLMGSGTQSQVEVRVWGGLWFDVPGESTNRLLHLVRETFVHSRFLGQLQ